MAIYRLAYPGATIDSGISKALKISDRIAENGQTLIWNGEEYIPSDLGIADLTTDDIVIIPSSNSSLATGEPLSNIIPAILERVSIQTAGENIILNPGSASARTPYIMYDTDISLNELIRVLNTRQWNSGYLLVNTRDITSVGTSLMSYSLHGSSSVEQVERVNKILIYFDDLTKTGSGSTSLLVGITSNGSEKMVPVLTIENSTVTSGYVELTNIGYTWKIEVVSYSSTGSSARPPSYIPAAGVTMTPNIFLYTEPIGPADTVCLKTSSDSITGAIKIYRYIR